MPVSTATAAAYITPVVIKTFINHGKRKAKKLTEGRKDELPLDSIFYDQAFHIVKAFIRLGTENTIESLQSFTNTHIPAQHWAAVAPVLIPLSVCNRAADILIDWFGPEELQKVVGGERWWQVRGLDGIDAEWVTENKYLTQDKINGEYSRKDELLLRMDKLQPVMLYLHGGGFFWGSINTHRYQVLRYAHKLQGRVFTVNYRKAPQYPWPCPLQDIIAAYLYLIEPPPDAFHTPIPPHKITIAGDSAGGNLCLTLLTILRDLSLPLPAGAVLISPWVDLTHSFPSILQNVATDIIPEHGFIARPSTLWPLDPLPPKGGRVALTETNPPPKPGEADTLKPSDERLASGEDEAGFGARVQSQEEMLASNHNGIQDSDSSGVISSESLNNNDPDDPRNSHYNIDFWEPKPPKLLMKDPHSIPLELRSQIQLYATNEQITHPLVSPVFQGSLGNLPPLYIVAGDAELLCDEIVYLAHRAAYPRDYPTREGLLRDARRQRENSIQFTKGTKVHLQLYDGMCHVPTIFTFTDSVRYAYRSIAEFARHVTQLDQDQRERNPFPARFRSRSSSASSSELASQVDKVHEWQAENRKIEDDRSNKSIPQSDVQNTQPSLEYRKNESEIQKAASDSAMIRERVNVYGQLRPMEPPEQIPVLKLKRNEVGILKEAPALKWKKGQDKWDRRYERRAKSVIKKRRHLEAKAAHLLANAFDQGLHLSPYVQAAAAASAVESSESLASSKKPRRRSSIGGIQRDRRWGPLDLEDENPPPSAIAKRRDTPEALALLKKHIYFTAPITHKTVPRMKHRDAIRAAVDPNDDPNKAPRQSTSEQQARAYIIPVHGLRIWSNILLYFGRKTSAKISQKRRTV